MSLLAINQFLDTLIKSAELVKKVQEIALDFSLSHEVKQIIIKLDQTILGNLQSAYGSIQDALMTGNIDTRRRSLDNAHSFLQGLTGLDLSISTANIPNARIVAYANYGIAIIHKMSHDDEIAAKYLLLAFRDGPRAARIEIAPDLYETLFEPRLTGIKEWYQDQIRVIDHKNYDTRMLKDSLLPYGEKALAVGFGALAVFGVVASLGRYFGGLQPAMLGVRELNEDANTRLTRINPQNYRQEDKFKLDMAYEDRLDSACRELAIEFLGGGSMQNRLIGGYSY